MWTVISIKNSIVPTADMLGKMKKKHDKIYLKIVIFFVKSFTFLVRPFRNFENC